MSNKKKRTVTAAKDKYADLINSVDTLLANAREKAFNSINHVLVRTYWEIGKMIVEFEQAGNEKAEYGSRLLNKLSQDLKLRHGKGFSQSNVYIMRLFYVKYPKFQTLSGKLSWSHHSLLLSVSDDLARGFYEKQCLKERWSVRELKRQINSMLFERVALSKDKNEVLILARKGQMIEKTDDIVKDPYVFEFLGFPQDRMYSEKKLEQKIIDNLQMFLLELGRGFAFSARQFRITLGSKHYYVDLVFYNRILKCFVLVDLKVGPVTHGDIGQMNMYLNYFKEEEAAKGDNPPIGIILAADKDHLMIKYALAGLSNRLFVSKYKLYLPTKDELENEVRRLL